MVRRLVLICATIGLAACVADPVAVRDPAPVATVNLLRNPTAPLGSQADVVTSDLAGVWHVRQSVEGAWPRDKTVEFAIAGPRLFLRAEVPQGYEQSLAGRYVSVSREAAKASEFPSEIWVLWFDFDRRTVALGDPDGSFVAILDHKATGGQDRIAAARDILDWYGYDMERLVKVGP